jgi:diguanylate cyclase (GGDEF)-like protein
MLLTIPLSDSRVAQPLLRQAQWCLQRGDVSQSVALAKSALLLAQEHGCLASEANALLYLAQGDRMVSRFRRAHQTIQRAVSLYQACGDLPGEAQALVMLSHTLSVMGHSDDGVESALLGLKLNAGGDALQQALSYNHLGVAYAYGWNFDKANQVFELSIAMLEDSGHWMETFLPRANQRAMEVTRCFFDRYYHGQFRSLDTLTALRLAHGPTTQAQSNLRVFQGTYLKNQALLGLGAGFESCWLGDLHVAQQYADVAQTAESCGNSNPSVLLVELWLRAEIAWAREEWLLAESHAKRMLDLAAQIDNEHMVSIAYLLLAQILSAQGQDRAAQAHLRMLKLRENNLRNEALKIREERIEWQVQARANHATARRLEQEALRLQQLALEDALTGLFNRRQLEQAVPGILRSGAERGMLPTMAFIDVDEFKHINDRFSHRTGDTVLKALAHILRAFVREGDLPVRLGGDEFVVVFADVNICDAESLAQRIHTAIHDYDWDALYPGLRVTASVGVAVAEAEDTLEDWLHRCDLCMYQEKDSKHQDLA